MSGLRAALACLCAALFAFAARAEPPVFPAQGTLQAAFTPWDDIDALLLEAIGDARRRVLVQAYLLTNNKMASALIAAHRRGVEVQVLLDARQLERVPSSVAPVLAGAGVPVWIETGYQNAHNKVLLVDPAGPHAIVITGSFNFTWTAQHRNAENVLIARDNPALAARYADNWERHRLAAKRYKE
jgi:phosphatidylserine/phosphatidylglycerophosphate/cardiolipin synthase-like enzyme